MGMHDVQVRCQSNFRILIGFSKQFPVEGTAVHHCKGEREKKTLPIQPQDLAWKREIQIPQAISCGGHFGVAKKKGRKGLKPSV